MVNKMIKFIFVILSVTMFAYIGQADEIDDIVPFIIQVESGGNPNAVSKAGAVGLMQITPIVLKEYNKIQIQEDEKSKKIWNAKHKDKLNGEYSYVWTYDGFPTTYEYTDLWDVRINVKIGTWYLRRLRDYYLKDVIPYIQWSEVSDNLGIIKRNYCLGKRQGNSILFINTEPCDIIDYEIHSQEDVILALILAAYNGGITRLRNNTYDINKMPKETRNYVRKVMKLYYAAKE